jgi:hypothetical protein
VIQGMIASQTRSWPNKAINELFDPETQAMHRTVVALIPKADWPSILSECDPKAAAYLADILKK